MLRKLKMSVNAYVPLHTLMVLFVIFLAFLIAVDSPLSMVHNLFHSEGENTKLAISKNRARVTKALDYINSHSTPMRHTPRNILKVDLDLLVVIVTVSRHQRSEDPGYLLQTAAGMDKLMKRSDYFGRKFMFICNVDNDPNQHSEAVTLMEYLPYVLKNGTNNMGLKRTPFTPMHNSGHGSKDANRMKEISDYAYCLQVSQRFNFKYLLVLEDDVIPYQNMFQVLDHTIKHKLPTKKIGKARAHQDNGSYGSARDFTFLKLYYPLEWQGYAWEIVPLLELVSLGTLGGVVFLLLSLIPLDNKRANPKRYISLLWPFLCGMLVSILIASILGRSYVMDLRRYSPFLFRFGKSSACCTQAMLYKKDVIQQMSDHILINTLKENSLNKDLAIYELTQKTGIPGYQIEPNLFQHVGMLTSLSDTRKEPDSYIFETHIFD